MNPKSRTALQARGAAILRRLPATPPVVVEVGVYLGHLGEHLLDARSDLTWVGVDRWASLEEHSEAYIATGDAHARLSALAQETYYKLTRERLARFGERAVIHRAWSVDVARTFAPESVDLAFVDGDHSYEGVKADLTAWWPKVRRGAWICGHDHAHPEHRFRFGVDRAVAEFSKAMGLPVELDANMTFFVRKP